MPPHTDHTLLTLIRTELAKSPWKIDPLRIHPTTHLTKDLELDSLDLEELLLNLELPLQTDLTQTQGIATIADLITHIRTRLTSGRAFSESPTPSAADPSPPR